MPHNAVGEPMPPCYGCRFRTPECHGDCESYREYKAAIDEFRKEERSAKMALEYARHGKPCRKEKSK